MGLKWMPVASALWPGPELCHRTLGPGGGPDLWVPEMEISHITAANSTQYRKQVLFVFGNRFESWPFPVGVTPISCGFVPAAATVCV